MRSGKFKIPEKRLNEFMNMSLKMGATITLNAEALRKPGRPVKELNEAVDWLKREIGKGKFMDDLRQMAEYDGLKWSTVVRAKNKLEIGQVWHGRLVEWVPTRKTPS